MEEQADIIVALTHIGIGDDQRLAEAVDYFDAIIGGHSHTTLGTPRVVNGTPIAQTGANLANVGKLVLEYNETTGEVDLVEGGLQSVASLADDNIVPEVQSTIDRYNSEMDEILSEVIGYSNTGLSRDGRYDGDAPLGNFWTDAMRDKAEAEIALTNNGGIRASIAPGDVTLGDIYAIEPFANELMVFEMTGQALKDVITYSYTRENRNQIDLQVSGMSYEIVIGPTGAFVDANLSIDGDPIELDKNYRVVVADYIGTGGGGYQMEGTVISETIGLMTDAMKDYALKLTDEGKALDFTRGANYEVSRSDSATSRRDHWFDRNRLVLSK